jgi:hypothetical protein
LSSHSLASKQNPIYQPPSRRQRTAAAVAAENQYSELEREYAATLCQLQQQQERLQKQREQQQREQKTATAAEAEAACDDALAELRSVINNIETEDLLNTLSQPPTVPATAAPGFADDFRFFRSNDVYWSSADSVSSAEPVATVAAPVPAPSLPMIPENPPTPIAASVGGDSDDSDGISSCSSTKNELPWRQDRPAVAPMKWSEHWQHNNRQRRILTAKRRITPSPVPDSLRPQQATSKSSGEVSSSSTSTTSQSSSSGYGTGSSIVGGAPQPAEGSTKSDDLVSEYKCNVCRFSSFKTKKALTRHFATKMHYRNNQSSMNTVYGKRTTASSNVMRPFWFFDPPNDKYLEDDDLIFHVNSLFDGCQGFEILFYSIENSSDLVRFISFFKNILTALVWQGMKVLQAPVKICISVELLMAHNLFYDQTHVTETANFFATSSFYDVINYYDVNNAVSNAVDDVIKREDQIDELEGSNWSIFSVTNGYLKIIKYSPLIGCGASCHSSLPAYLRSKAKSLLNIVQDDGFASSIECKCLLQSIIAKRNIHSYPGPTAFSASFQESIKSINVSGIKNFPIPLNDFEKLENNNGFGLNVFVYEDLEVKNENPDAKKTLLPLRISNVYCNGDDCAGDDEKCKKVIDLLLIQNDYTSAVSEICTKCKTDFCIHKDKHENHYVVIRSLRMHLYSRKSYVKHVCRKCFAIYPNFENYLEHAKVCYSSDRIAQILEMPKGDKKFLFFKNHHREIPVPYVIFFDFECFLKEIQIKSGSATRRTHTHVPAAYCFVIVDSNNRMVIKPVVHYDSNPKSLVHHFIDNLLRYHKQLRKEFKKNQSPLIITPEMDRLKMEAHTCSLCGKLFGVNEMKVFNHRHYIFDPTDKSYLQGISCVKCNLAYKPTYKTIVIAHNLQKYDGHLLIPYLKKYREMGMRVELLAKSSEKFLSLTIGPLEFRDSMNFISGSLDSCSSILKDADYMFTREVFPDHFDLVRYKIPFPYTAFSDDETARSLPALLPKERFYSEIKREHITDEQYEKLRTTCHTFRLVTLLDLCLHYIVIDTLLLAEVGTNLRKIFSSLFSLDYLHYITLTSLSWDYLLKNTGARIELLGDIDQFNFVASGLNGGLSSINTGRVFSSKNKDIGNLEAGDERASSLFLTDVNSLYPNTFLRNKIYIDSPRFLTKEEIKSFDLFSQVNRESDYAYIIQCDVIIEKSHYMHSLLRRFPILPRNRVVTYEDLSPHTKLQLEEHHIHFSKQSRLIADLENKYQYVLQGELLKFCVQEFGIRFENVTKILKFRASNWINSHIEKLLRFRLEHSGNKLLDKAIKAAANCLFGKSCQKKTKERDFRIVTNEKTFQRLSNSAYFKNYKIVNDETVTVELAKRKVILNTPNIIAQQILDLSRLHMYKLLYSEILPSLLGPEKQLWNSPKQPITLDVVYTDTDSLLLYLTYPSSYSHYECLRSFMHVIDTTAFSTDHFLYRPRQPVERFGLLKVENYPHKLLRVVLCKSKLYCLIYEGEKLESKCKGATASTAKLLTEKHYLDAVDRNYMYKANQATINSYNSNLYTIITNKQIINSIDYKNYYFNERECTSYGDILIGEVRFNPFKKPLISCITGKLKPVL